MWMKLDKVRLAHRVEEGLVDRRRGLGLGFLLDDDLLRVDDDKVEAEMDGYLCMSSAPFSCRCSLTKSLTSRDTASPGRGIIL